jgi:hypothetical protein
MGHHSHLHDIHIKQRFAARLRANPQRIGVVGRGRVGTNRRLRNVINLCRPD